MKHRRFAITAGVGCAILALLMIVVIPATFLLPIRNRGTEGGVRASPINFVNPFQRNEVLSTPQSIPGIPNGSTQTQQEFPESSPDHLIQLYEKINPGVVNINGFGFPSSPSLVKSGSGIIIKEEGYILTSGSLVADAAYQTVTFFNGVEAEARLIGYDRVSDLALLKVDRLPEVVQPLALADSVQVKVGEWVIVISNPSGLSNRMNTGIISAIGPAHIGLEADLSIPEVYQIDRIIRDENLGSPLMNYQGSVIGITTQIPFEDTQPGTETGHAIPSMLANRVAAELVKQGSYAWPWLGVEGLSVNIPIMKANQLETPQGVYVQSIIPGSPADKAGLQGSTGTKTVEGTQVAVGGDVFIDVDGKPVDGFDDFLSIISEKSPGEEIMLTIIRNGNRQEISVKLAKQPED